MNTPTTELIFPPKLIPNLRDLRDAAWAQLVDKVSMASPYNIDRLAFELMVVRWSGCANCQADSYRAMQGCTQCASQAVRRYRGNSAELEHIFDEICREIDAYVNNRV